MSFVDDRFSPFDTDTVVPRGNHFADKFGVTEAKSFPPYVFSTSKNGCLIHKVDRVELHWYRIAGHGHKLVRVTRPKTVRVYRLR